MKAKSFALLVAGIVLCAVSSAQGNSIIDNCCFVNRSCVTNQEWVNGWHAFQRNECPASQPVAPASASVSAPAGQPIDNCCNVNRQCVTNQEWVNGWHAFRRNECPVGQPVAPASAPAGQPIDNCCYVDRQCNSDQDWVNGWSAYRNGQCGAPGRAQTVASFQPGGGAVSRTATGIVIGHAGANGILPTTEPYYWRAIGERWSTTSCCDHSWQCNSHQDRVEGFRVFQTNLPNIYCPLPGLISIVGDPDFVAYYQQRLAQLQRLPQRYNYALEGLNKIEQLAIEHFTHVSITDRIYFVKWGGPGSNGQDTRDTAVLVREACRVHAYDAKVRWATFDQEVYNNEDVVCREMELAALHELGAPPHVIERASSELAGARARL